MSIKRISLSHNLKKEEAREQRISMSDERRLEPVNTPETLGVTPRFVLQHNAISRAAHNLSATAKKLTAMAMALLPLDLSTLTAAFTFTEFCDAVGYEKGGESFKLFLAALKECVDNTISIEITSTNGKKRWENYTWFVYSDFDDESGVATMTFSPQLATVLQELIRVYAKINLKDLGELQSKYALRIFEIASSYESFKGKNGNASDTWYFDRTIPELRMLFQVPEDAYKKTKDFRKKVIDEPIREINNAGIGVTITAESIKKGTRLMGIHFGCEKTARTVPGKRRGKKKGARNQAELPELAPKTAALRQEKENQHLKELYPDEFATLYTEELGRNSFLPKTSEFRKIAADAAAVARLREKYGVVK